MKALNCLPNPRRIDSMLTKFACLGSEATATNTRSHLACIVNRIFYWSNHKECTLCAIAQCAALLCVPVRPASKQYAQNGDKLVVLAHSSS